MKDYLYILGCIFFTVYGQLVLKWRLSNKGAFPEDSLDKMWFLVKAFLDPFVVSGFLSAFIASLCWMVAMTKFDLSIAYPFMSLAFVLVFILSIFFFNEPFTLGKLLGLLLICAGVIVTVRVK